MDWVNLKLGKPPYPGACLVMANGYLRTDAVFDGQQFVATYWLRHSDDPDYGEPAFEDGLWYYRVIPIDDVTHYIMYTKIPRPKLEGTE